MTRTGKLCFPEDFDKKHTDPKKLTEGLTMPKQTIRKAKTTTKLSYQDIMISLIHHMIVIKTHGTFH